MKFIFSNWGALDHASSFLQAWRHEDEDWDQAEDADVADVDDDDDIQLG